MKLMSLTSARDVLYLDPERAHSVGNQGGSSVSTILHPAAEAFKGPKYL
jgi:hypothetical protein